MTESSRPRHVYLRQIDQGERTSLSLLAGLVPAGATVLDLGTGSGALGAHLSAHGGCVVDGVTISAEEAALATTGYRRLVVADLEDPNALAVFSDQRYDRIVCADVLEHLREPEQTLQACRALLAPGGSLLISVPNAGYCGLVADLLQGDFRYRKEGLLDRTHLRFFTRRSLLETLAGQGYGVRALHTVERPLNESEFHTRFDDLPPAVARYLLATPDAGTYQLIAQAEPDVGHAPGVERATGDTAVALFTAQLYWAGEQGYAEAQKITVAGRVGTERQTLRFAVPADATRLRLDPADRPGFLHLHGMRVLAGADERWRWTPDDAGLRTLEACTHQQMAWRAGWPAAAGLVLLLGDDPWVELPVPHEVLAGAHGAATLEVDLGWPMSADYLALAGLMRPLADDAGHLRAEAQAVRAALQGEQRRAAHAEARLADAQQELTRLSSQLDASSALAAAREAELTETQHRMTTQAREVDDLRRRQGELSLDVRQLTQERLGLQRELGESRQQFQQLADHLRWIENSTVFRATRPLVHAKMALDRLLGRAAAPQPAPLPPAERRIEPTEATVDVIVPVYRGLDDTRCCIESVIASQCRTPWRLVVINDCSPEPEVTQWLRDTAAREPRMLLLENEQNLGFVGTVNRGMSVSDRHDVVLLNSDAEVANDWLDRIRAAAYRDARVASVTPFSNNATICSYPKFCEANELPPGWDTARLDRVFAEANAGQALDVPTGVGFCMYIRRDCLREVGLFDVEQFGKGYGEENDFCRRAADAGWRNLHALDCFVRHAGGVSFGASKSQRELDAMEKLRRLHPTYEPIVMAYVAQDPARVARLRADIQRVATSGLPVVLAVLHNRGGGTQRHASELARHFQGRAIFFSLSPAAGGSVWLERLEDGAAFRLAFQLPQDWDRLLDALRGLGVVHVHYHHVIGHADRILGLARELGVSWDFTAHDYYPMCPAISLTGTDDRYCGEDGSGRCKGCARQAPGGDLAGWRQRHGEFLGAARAVLAPSRDTALRYARMWPALRLHVAPHTDITPEALPTPHVKPLQAGTPLRVAVLGGLSRIKGADVLEAVAERAARQGAPLEFHLIGHGYRSLRTQPQAALTVHGAYQEEDLPRLLEWLQPHLVWFPAQWPETYSYTLSACLQAGLPVLAPDLGAFPERLAGRAWSWVVPWNLPAAEMVGELARIREAHFVAGVAPPPPATSAAAGAAEPPSWSHDLDYLRGVAARPVTGLAVDLLAASRPEPVAGIDVPRQPLKRVAMAGVQALRRSAALAWVARLVPAQVQRRVKDWLLA